MGSARAKCGVARAPDNENMRCSPGDCQKTMRPHPSQPHTSTLHICAHMEAAGALCRAVWSNGACHAHGSPQTAPPRSLPLRATSLLVARLEHTHSAAEAPLLGPPLRVKRRAPRPPPCAQAHRDANPPQGHDVIGRDAEPGALARVLCDSCMASCRTCHRVLRSNSKWAAAACPPPGGGGQRENKPRLGCLPCGEAGARNCSASASAAKCASWSPASRTDRRKDTSSRRRVMS